MGLKVAYHPSCLIPNRSPLASHLRESSETVMCQDEPVVVTHELTKKYGRLTALDGLSISLGLGQILGSIGPNGAGKTTTIKILVGLARPTSGWARVAGADCVRDARKIKRLVGYMPDTFGSFDNMRVRACLAFFRARCPCPRIGLRR